MEPKMSLGVGVKIHPSAVVEPGVIIGSRSVVWDNAHIRHNTKIGEECIIGEKTYIAYSVEIGNRVKINSHVYLCTGVTLEDGVMVSAGAIFTNDRCPRAATTDLKALRPSDPNESTLPTFVRQGATIGAGAVVGCGLEIGQFAMVGMGSIVTRDIPPFFLAFGQPARPRGLVCRCGHVLLRFSAIPAEDITKLRCDSCSLQYRFENGRITETSRAGPGER